MYCPNKNVLREIYRPKQECIDPSQVKGTAAKLLGGPRREVDLLICRVRVLLLGHNFSVIHITPPIDSTTEEMHSTGQGRTARPSAHPQRHPYSCPLCGDTAIFSKHQCGTGCIVFPSCASFRRQSSISYLFYFCYLFCHGFPYLIKFDRFESSLQNYHLHSN